MSCRSWPNNGPNVARPTSAATGLGTSVFDGAPDLEFRMATEGLELERSGLSYQRVPPPAIAFRTATRTGSRRRCRWPCAGAGG
jgi:hypothetical protein